MASADAVSGGVDVETLAPRLSSYLSLPEDTVSQALTHISQEFVAAVIRKSREQDEINAAKLRVDVELEQAIRSADTRVRSMKSQLDAALSETQELRMKVSSTETARSALENELVSYRSSQTGVDEELRVLRVRVQALESDKRDAMEALDRKCNDYDTLQEEFSAAQAKTIEARREAGAFETQLQQAQSAQTSAKFREQSLAQELELVRKNNEWLDNELKTKAADHQKLRREKAAEISNLQTELDEAISKSDMAQRNLDNLKQRYEELSQKAESRLTKIKDLQSRLVSQEENFKNEMSSQVRLAQLFEQSSKSAKARVAELEQQIDQEQQRESVEIGQLQAELETERREREAAEAKVAELEIQVERLESDLAVYASSGHIVGRGASPAGSINGNSTPMRRSGSAVGTPGSAFSPAASRLAKSGMSVTQLYSDYSQMKASYESEKRRNAKLEEAITDLMEELEQKAPEIQELRDEHERLQKDLVEMSTLMEETAKERDRANREMRKFEGKVADHERESQLLRQQLRDLSNQVQVLLVEIENRDTEAEQLTPAQNRLYEQIIRGERAAENESDTDRIITQRLAVFRSVKELQEQNESLLKGIRELGERLEKEEEERRRVTEAQTTQEVEDLKARLVRMGDEMKSLVTKSQSFIRERDMFRRMLQNRGDIPSEGEQANRRQSGAMGVDADSLGGQNVGDVIRELQSQYDAFKTEALENHNTLNEQARKLSHEKTELEIQVGRLNSQLEIAVERHDLLKGNFDMLKEENRELSQRLTSMHESQHKQDLKTQTVAEELIESKSLIEGMRNENANLKAEKSIWKNIEQRLSQDNELLTQERARLNGLVANLQQIQSERDRSESETRRRLQTQVDKLESELQATKRRLNEEIEEAKKTSIRKDFDAKEAQRRIDELNTTIATVRENAVEAKTSRDYLQSRVDELTVSLKAAEEKLSVYNQPKQPTVAPVEPEDDDALSKEQELQMEVAELKQTLDLTKHELENMTTQVHQYKEIAQASEEELRDMNEVHDQYKESMEEQVVKLEERIRDLEQRVEEVTTELNAANQELTQVRQSEVEKHRHLEDEKAILESQIAGLKDDVEKAGTSVQYYQEDLRRQANIAHEAQQNYERELVKHAEAAKMLQEVRNDYTELKNRVHTIQVEAESATARLASSESSWATQRDNYEKELGEIKTRHADLTRQNKLLLGQIENVSQQISGLHDSRNRADEAAEGDENPNPQTAANKSLEDLREVVRYLRREKEIVDVQYELQIQETKRLKQQLEYTRNQLDESRVLLESERQRETDQLRGVTQHKELMEKISELNILRESNTTLRSESERKSRKIEELQKRSDELQAKIQPLEEQVRMLEADKGVQEDQIKLLKEDNDRWKARAQQILQKYDRVDPAELEALKEQAATAESTIAGLTAERDAAKAELDEIQTAQRKELETTAESWRTKLNEFKGKALTQIGEARKGIQAKEAEILTLQSTINTFKEEKERVDAEMLALTERATKAEALRDQHLKKAREVNRELSTLKQSTAQNATRFEALEQEKNGLVQQLAVAQAVQTSNSEVAPAPTAMEVDNAAAIEEEVQKRVADVKKELEAQQLVAPSTDAQIDPEAIEAEVQKRVEEFREAMRSEQPDPAAIEAEVQRRVDERLPAIEADIENRLAASQPTPIAPPEVPVHVEPDRTAEIEAEVAKRVADALEKNGEAPPAYVPPAEPTADIDAIVEERVTAVKEELAKKAEEEKKRVDGRIEAARANFQKFLKKNLADQAEKLNAEAKGREDALQNTIQNLQQEIGRLQTEVDELKKALAEARTRAEVAEATAAAAGSREEGEVRTDPQELERALAAKEAEHQAELEKIRQEHEASKEYLRQELEVEAQAQALAANQQAQLDENGQPKPVQTKEAIKHIVKVNVEHRMKTVLERERAALEKDIERQVAERVAQSLNGKTGGKDEELEAKVRDLEQKLAESEQRIKAAGADIEKQKDALRQEGAARMKVQLSMMEKKNQNLQEQLKGLTGGQPTTTGAPTQHAGQGQRRQSQIPGQPQQQRPQIAANGQQPQMAQTQANESNPASAAKQQGQGHGTGPATLRGLRGALGSGLPRANAAATAAAGRGSGRGIPVPGSQPMSTATSPSQVPAMPAANPFASQLPSNIPSAMPNPFAQPPQQQQQQQQQQNPAQQGGRGGRGGFKGRAQAPGGVQTGIPRAGSTGQQQSGPMSPGTQARGAMNPSARQFVPGKRGREESSGEAEESAGRGEGKRARGH